MFLTVMKKEAGERVKKYFKVFKIKLDNKKKALTFATP